MACNELLQKIESYSSSNFDIDKIIKAFEFTKEAHKNQIRASGEPYFYHPLSVAIILAEMHLDEDSIITALLHDTVEDTNVNLNDIREQFGERVAKLVDGVTKLAKIKFQSDNIREKENFRKLLMAMSQDIRVLIVKLADRLHNVRTLNFLPEQKAKRIALETMEIYAPLAERIGMQKMKNELQDLAFAKLYPEERESILKRLNFLRSDEGFLIDRIETHIKKTINDFGIYAEVQGREKTPCSIWQKMKLKNISFAQLSDIIAFRVIVNDLMDCYQVLGIIHAAYHMIPDSFKDYISTPKSNGYSSLHTVVVGPNKQRIEIQIRTKEMHHFNEWGVAAHWGYKQKIDTAKQTDTKRFKWIGELLNILENSETEDFLEHTKLEMYEDQVFCFTPKGELMALPKNATPIDFAYALHSDIGNTCAGAKINGNISPLKTKLENGDQVEIICSKNQLPSSTWEKFVVTAKAKLEIKKYIRSKHKKEHISLGKSILIKYFQNEGKEFKEEMLRDHLNSFHKKNIDDLYLAVGEETLNRKDVYNAIFGKPKSKLSNLTEKFSFFKFNKNKSNKNDQMPIRGVTPGSSYNFASCCNPLPGEQIIGVISADKKITIHTADCDLTNNLDSPNEKIIEVYWEKDNNDLKHLCRLKMTITNEINSLASVCDAIAKQKCNINNLKLIARSSDFFELVLDIEVMGVSQLSNIIATLRAKESVHYVERYKM